MKIREVAHLLKKINANPTKLQKIKKNLMVNALQQEIENECELEENHSENKRSASNPTISTGIIAAPTRAAPGTKAARYSNRPKDNRFV